MTANELRAWRTRVNLSQSGAAAALRVPLASYRQWETARRPCPPLLDMATLAVTYAAEIQARQASP